MKKLILIVSFLAVASPAWAIIYKWTDQGGTINFTDTYDRVPPGYRDSVEQISVPKSQTPFPSRTSVEKTPANAGSKEIAIPSASVTQTSISEGNLAIKLAEAFKLGEAENEAEAESVLAAAGIVPKHGWIADYPVAPGIVGELQDSVGVAVDSGKLSLNKDEALKTLENLATWPGSPSIADTESQVAEAESSLSEGEYDLDMINEYYFDQGAPVVTYYPYDAGDFLERGSRGFPGGGGRGRR